MNEMINSFRTNHLSIHNNILERMFPIIFLLIILFFGTWMLKRANSPAERGPVLKMADVVSLHLPNLPENRDFMDAEKLAMMIDNSIPIVLS